MPLELLQRCSLVHPEFSGMRKISLIFMFCLLICGTVFGEDSVSKISNFVDPFGNQGSFWQVSYKGKPYKVLKLKSPDRNGEADFAFDDVTLSDFEDHVAEMKRTPNTLKADGFKVLWSRQFGDASVRTILGRLNGVKVKMIHWDRDSRLGRGLSLNGSLVCSGTGA